MIISIIAAMAEGDRGIGLRGDLPWRLPADMARFREFTMGHTVIMGHATWEPIAERGLPGRRVIVLSRAGVLESADAVASSLSEAVQIAAQDGRETETFIAGGAQVYQEALDRALVDRMYLTIVHGQVGADSFFPIYDSTEWTTVKSEVRAADERNPFRMTFCCLERT
ncbi:MAG: dihydrofolate reductase [Anaerolineae bacterium]|nr:MAG: dihydrofolate reductase [Anaerolineae bacterium]